jgi:hypothetical protein
VIEIRCVAGFAEPSFSSLQRAVFEELDGADGTAVVQSNGVVPPHAVRLGAFEVAQLVGWAYGWVEDGGSFYMANSGVVKSFRRRGVYSTLVAHLERIAAGAGAERLRSRHLSTNSAIIAAKLKLGFCIVGSVQDEVFGPMVLMEKQLANRLATLPTSASSEVRG